MASNESIYVDPLNPYVHVPLVLLKRDYVALKVVGTPTGKNSTMFCGTTYLFWVVGDGSKTLVYRTSGNAEIVSNRDFVFVEVVDAQKSMVAEGRIMYLPTEEGSDWIDLGPILPHAYNDSDPKFDEIRKAHLLCDVTPEEELDNVEDSKFMSMGTFSSKEKW
jgi:hypothetical protein